MLRESPYTAILRMEDRLWQVMVHVSNLIIHSDESQFRQDCVVIDIELKKTELRFEKEQHFAFVYPCQF